MEQENSFVYVFTRNGFPYRAFLSKSAAFNFCLKLAERIDKDSDFFEDGVMEVLGRFSAFEIFKLSEEEKKTFVQEGLHICAEYIYEDCVRQIAIGEGAVFEDSSEVASLLQDFDD